MQLLSQYRGVPNSQELPPLTEAQILKWARAHYRQTEAWSTEMAHTSIRPDYACS